MPISGQFVIGSSKKVHRTSHNRPSDSSHLGASLTPVLRVSERQVFKDGMKWEGGVPPMSRIPTAQDELKLEDTIMKRTTSLVIRVGTYAIMLAATGILCPPLSHAQSG